jgi:hypothetical protein
MNIRPAKIYNAILYAFFVFTLIAYVNLMIDVINWIIK